MTDQAPEPGTEVSHQFPPGFGFTAEAIGSDTDGTRILMRLTFSAVLDDSPEDPRAVGEGFVLGQPPPAIQHAFDVMAHVILQGGLEVL